MSGPELHALVFACLGPRPALAAREATLALLKGGTRVALRYEWIVDWKRFAALVERDDVELGDGEEWVHLWT